MDKSNISVGIFMDRENEKPVEEVQKTTATKNRGDGTVDVIEIKHLTQIFNEGTPNEYRLFEDFNLTIPDFIGKGQLISVMGGSGCGKSQLLRAIAGLSKIPKGDIKIYGKDIY